MKNLNKIPLVLIAVAAISFSSCKKEKEQNALIGTWTRVDAKVEFTSTNALYATLLNELASVALDGVELPEKLTFNADNTGVFGENQRFTYTKTENKLTLKSAELGMLNNLLFDYSISGTELKMNGDLTSYLPLFKEVANFYLDANPLPIPLPISVDEIMNSITKIALAATFKK